MMSLPNRKTLPALLALVALILTAVACKNFFPGRKLASIAVTATTIPYIAVPGTVKMQAIGTFDDNSTKDITTSVTWTSSAAGVATVDSKGVVTSVANSFSTIKATVGPLTGQTQIVVGFTPTSLIVTPASNTVTLSTGTLQYKVVTTFSDPTLPQLDITKFVKWSSSPSANVGFSTSTAGLASLLVTGTNITITADPSTATGLTGITTLTINP